MKTFILFVFLTSFGFALQDTAIVRFKNGDKISGSAVALDLQTLTWKSDLLNNQAQFKLDQILDLQLPAKLDNQSAEQASHEAVLELTNGDSVRGLLAGLSDQEIRLQTWYAGELVFRRVNVKSININRNSKVLYRGPHGIDDWKVTGDDSGWSFAENEFIAKKPGSIGREIDFTDEVKVSYDLRWKGMMRTKMILFTDDVEAKTHKKGYEIIFHGSMVRIRRLSDNIWLGSNMVSRRMQANEKSNIEIQISKKSKRILIFIDEELQGSWQDEGMDNLDGKGLVFASEYNYETAISNILVSEWDGFVDESLTEEMQFRDPRFGIMHMNRGNQMQSQTESKELPEGRMLLANGDTLEGEVLGIENEMIKIKTPFTEIVFPVHRINNIALKSAKLETPKLYNGDVRAVLADGSKLVFRLDDVKDGKLIGFSQNFGRAEFVQSAFKRIEFNIYPKPKAN